MLSPTFVDGIPNWIDLGTPDLDGATAFYHGLFGWDLVPGGPEVGGYGMYTLGGRTAAGVMKVPAEQSKSAWSVFFQSPDASATAKKVERAGGAVLLEPMDVMEFGRMAGFKDNAGAYFGVWQPKENPGLGVVREPGSFLWAELYTPQVPPAAAFFQKVFGWQTDEMGFGGGEYTYTTVRPANTGPDSAFGGLVPFKDSPTEAAAGPHWLPYFTVDDVDAAVAAAKRLGGKETLAAMDIPEVGRMANLADPYGAAFAVIRPAPRQAG
ncbi:MULTISPECIES: VOC family protein [unclassified Streptomyces]|uniref:VOC family protein n=1 Tax=unclassified Streptomyces TaxID=2593676 RepID=UPI002DDBB464|nr:VOC family protein [Streptomyces sp. NBC_01237]WRZ76253.1 VOC family protein [Streptomyces sp. NBC_01237]